MSTTFAALGVPAPVVATLTEHGITAPFPIQAMTLPDALAGRDLCGKAPTGSGKTIAFGIPLVATVGGAEPRRPRGLVLVPTRELASQVRDELMMLAGPRGPRVEAFYGGNGFGSQLNALRRGVEIAVACPGRLMDLVNRGDVKLDAVDFVVIDEADRMADMGFLPEVRRLLDLTPSTRQTLLFSATLDGDVDVLVRDYQRQPARHELAADPSDGARVTHRFWHVPREQRIKRCAEVVTTSGPTIVFCRTKRGADRVARQLDQAGVRSAAIHGDRSQAQRERALESFHRGQIDALVATDVAARGIHVDGVCAVVHLDPPADEKDYVHRSGRTGRAGAEGVVVTFVAPELRKDVTRLQRSLELPTVITSPDESPLPAVPRPERRASRPARPYQTVGQTATKAGGPRRRPTSPASPASPRRAARPKQARGDRPERGSSTARTGSSRGSSSSREAGRKGSPSSGASTSSGRGATPATSQGNRKARRAHLQPGYQGGGDAGRSAGRAAAPSTRAKRAAGPDKNKGKRRQPSGRRG